MKRKPRALLVTLLIAIIALSTIARVGTALGKSLIDEISERIMTVNEIADVEGNHCIGIRAGTIPIGMAFDDLTRQVDDLAFWDSSFNVIQAYGALQDCIAGAVAPYSSESPLSSGVRTDTQIPISKSQRLIR